MNFRMRRSTRILSGHLTIGTDSMKKASNRFVKPEEIYELTLRSGKRCGWEGNRPYWQFAPGRRTLGRYNCRAPLYVLGPTGPFYMSVPNRSTAWMVRALSNLPYDSQLDWPHLSWVLATGRKVPATAIKGAIDKCRFSFGPVFGAVVNPYLRAASYYITHIKDGLDGNNHFNYHYAKRIRFYSLKSKFEIEHISGISFSEFINYFCNESIKTVRHESRAFSWAYWRDLNRDVSIIRLEYLIEDLCKHVEISDQVLESYRNFDLKRALGLEGVDLDELYSPADIETVREFYSSDFSDLSYDPVFDTRSFTS